MKKYLIEIKWGLIFVIMMLLWMYLEKSMGWHDEKIADHATYTNFVAIPAILIYVLALWEKRNRYFNGKMSWKQGFISGLIITLVVVILAPFSQIITHEIITPDYFKNAIEHAVSTGMSTQEEAENYFNFQTYLWISIPMAAIQGALTSAIVAIFLRKK